MYGFPEQPWESVNKRKGIIAYLMNETTDEKLLGCLMAGQREWTFPCPSGRECYWTRSKQKAFHDWVGYMTKCVQMADDEDDGNFVEPTEFEEFTYHGTTFWKNTDGKCQWFYEYNNGEVGDELGIYTSDTELEFSDGEGKDATDYVPVLYWAGLAGDVRRTGIGLGTDTIHPLAKIMYVLWIYDTDWPEWWIDNARWNRPWRRGMPLPLLPCARLADTGVTGNGWECSILYHERLHKAVVAGKWEDSVW